MGTLNAKAIYWMITVMMLLSPTLIADPGDTPAKEHVADAGVPVEDLRLMVRPMTKKELSAELDAWMSLLKKQLSETSALTLKFKPQKEDDNTKISDEEEKKKTDSYEKEAAIVERVKIVIDALKAKGGDVCEAENYLSAVMDLKANVEPGNRMEALYGGFKVWLKNPDGGKYFAKRMFIALSILFAFWIMSKFAGRATKKVLLRQPRTSTMLKNFAQRVAGTLVMFVGFIVALATLGVQVGPLMAAMGAFGFIIGFALQETLGNFASGLMIMIYQPFDVDDVVTVAGVKGKVEKMSLVATTLLSFDNKELIIPNKKAWGETITNYTSRDLRRVDLVFGVAYDDDIEQVASILEEMARAHPLVLQDPAPEIGVDTLADSSINLFCRPWVNTENYWTVQWDLTREVKKRFDAQGISIPFPQRDVHLHQSSNVETA